jgi:VIT1/CCC1 family predicted Fe2+/Mn2+ transporter
VNRDVEASQRAHEVRLHNLEHGEPLEENHSNLANAYLKSIIYGGLDGIITTFATVTSVAGAHFSSIVVIVLGISHLFADGLSMGFGDALSTQAELDYNKSERRREQWEMENNMQVSMHTVHVEYSTTMFKSHHNN